MEQIGSASVSGTYEGYEGLYNFFNYGANDEGDPIVNGLKYAKEEGWTDPYKAILGGAKLIGSSYVGQGQNTSYFFKFDVVGNSILKATDGAKQVSKTLFFSHQYMTNIMDPYSQSSSVYNMYASNGNLDASLNFIIPVFENMPDTNKKPTKFEDSEDLYYAKNSLKVRDYTSSSSPVVYTLEKDEVVRMIARESKTVDGIKWDRIELENGWNCWTESSGLICCTIKQEIEENDKTQNEEKEEEKPEIKDEEKEETNKLLSIDNKNLQIKLISSTTVADIIKAINVKEYTILDNKNNSIKKDEEKLATGYKIKANNKTYTLIKLGDVNGNAEVDVIDLALMKRHLMETQKLTSVYYKAGMIQKDGTEIDVIDLALLKRVLVGTTTITL